MLGGPAEGQAPVGADAPVGVLQLGVVVQEAGRGGLPALPLQPGQARSEDWGGPGGTGSDWRNMV